MCCSRVAFLYSCGCVEEVTFEYSCHRRRRRRRNPLCQAGHHRYPGRYLLPPQHGASDSNSNSSSSSNDNDIDKILPTGKGWALPPCCDPGSASMDVDVDVDVEVYVETELGEECHDCALLGGSGGSGHGGSGGSGSGGDEASSRLASSAPGDGSNRRGGARAPLAERQLNELPRMPPPPPPGTDIDSDMAWGEVEGEEN